MTAETASGQPRYFEQGFTEHAQSIGVGEGLKPAEKVIVFATAGRTPLGTLPETFDAAMMGKSGIKKHDFIENWRSNNAGLTEFDPTAHFTRLELKRMTGVEALSVVLTRELMADIELLNSSGKLKSEDLQRGFGVCVGAGVGPTPHLAKVLNAIEGGVDRETGEKSRARGSRNIDVNSALYAFPQKIAGSVARDIGAQGWSDSITAACATGGANISALYNLIKMGRLEAGIAGGVDYFNKETEQDYIRLIVGMFAIMKVTSAREEAEKASRPFDSGRDGFVPSNGGALMGLASEAYALRHGLPILAELLAAENSIDGFDLTNMDSNNVGRTILRTVRDPNTGTFYVPDYFAHATSTPEGDKGEVAALKHAFGDAVSQVRVTNIKPHIGHLLGGAASTNAGLGVEAIQRNELFPLINVETPMEEVMEEGKEINLALAPQRGVDVVTTVGMGFDGFNAMQTFGRYRAS